MVVRTRGGVRQGMWFSADVVVVDIAGLSGSTFLQDLVDDTDVDGDGFINESEFADAVNSGLEQVIEAIQLRGTVLGVTVLTDAAVSVLVDYGQGYDPDNVALGNQTPQDIDAELVAAINAISGFSGATVAALRGFTGNALGTPD